MEQIYEVIIVAANAVVCAVVVEKNQLPNVAVYIRSLLPSFLLVSSVFTTSSLSAAAKHW